MNVLDYVLLGILAAFMVRGYMTGFFFQVLQIVGVVLAFFLAVKFHTDLAATRALSGAREHSQTAAQVISFLVIFFAVAAVASVFSSLLSGKARKKHLKSGDSLLGALLGLGKGVLLLGGVALGLQEWRLPRGAIAPLTAEERVDDWVTESVLVPRLTDGCLAIVAMIPQRSREEVARVYDKHRRILNFNPPPPEKVEAGAGALDGSPTEESRIDRESNEAAELLDLGTLWRLNREASRASSRPVPSSGKLEEYENRWETERAEDATERGP